eukprot:Blabericola_migrator_1__5065@NODE_2622_length_2526_cov_33_929646_g1643_i0_p2_GENE_NODE_2622_length_2526_cov_33_929646_g1643_i0NODE_2622_length_2526_cov_33_929646_g1643_i0_p2_ORF_typecomplete_len106_score12_61_NODE_2622_length_2526_cov_33_929646_g1643_i022092526
MHAPDIDKRLRYLEQDGGLLPLDSGSQKRIAPCPWEVSQLNVPLKATEKLTHLRARRYPSYILGPPPPPASGEQSTINMDRVDHGIHDAPYLHTRARERQRHETE